MLILIIYGLLLASASITINISLSNIFCGYAIPLLQLCLFDLHRKRIRSSCPYLALVLRAMHYGIDVCSFSMRKCFKPWIEVLLKLILNFASRCVDVITCCDRNYILISTKCGGVDANGHVGISLGFIWLRVGCE